MARYDYQCPNCGTRFEVEHPMSARPKVTCPRCGQEAKHVFETSGIVFKGSGFYNTDQRGKKCRPHPGSGGLATHEASFMEKGHGIGDRFIFHVP